MRKPSEIFLLSIEIQFDCNFAVCMCVLGGKSSENSIANISSMKNISTN